MFYTVSRKTKHSTFGHNFGNVDRFLKFFNWQIPKEIVSVVEISTSSQLHCFTSLLWSPNGIGQTIIFSSCGFSSIYLPIFFFFLA